MNIHHNDLIFPLYPQDLNSTKKMDDSVRVWGAREVREVIGKPTIMSVIVFISRLSGLINEVKSKNARLWEAKSRRRFSFFLSVILCYIFN